MVQGSTDFLRSLHSKVMPSELAVALKEFMACKMAAEHGAGRDHFACEACTGYRDTLQFQAPGLSHPLHFSENFVARGVGSVHIDSNVKARQGGTRTAYQFPVCCFCLRFQRASQSAHLFWFVFSESLF